MSIKDLDVSNPAKLSQFELQYAFDRYLIDEDTYNEHRASEEGEGDTYDNKRKWTGPKLVERAEELGLDPNEYSDREGIVGAIRAKESEG